MHHVDADREGVIFELRYSQLASVLESEGALSSLKAAVDAALHAKNGERVAANRTPLASYYRDYALLQEVTKGAATILCNGGVTIAHTVARHDVGAHSVTSFYTVGLARGLYAERNLVAYADAEPSVPAAHRAALGGGGLARRAHRVWTNYEALLIVKPMQMQIVQAIVLSCIGNLFNQCVLLGREIDGALIAEQVAVNIVLAPITIWWLRLLRSWKLHWIAASLADQCGFMVVLNPLVFWFIAAGFRGGLTLGGGGSGPGRPGIALLAGFGRRLTFDRSVFPSVFEWSPIWSTRVRGLQLKLPTTLVREKLVPQHLKGLFELVVRIVWNVFIAAVLEAWRVASSTS